MIDSRECPRGEDCSNCEGECIHDVGGREYNAAVVQEALLTDAEDDDLPDEVDDVEGLAELPPGSEDESDEAPNQEDD